MKKIKTVTVTKLFGYAKNNYTVNLLENEPLTFIYAFNGVGKTTLFRLIDAAIKTKMTVLDSIIFDSLKITFDTDEILTVKKLFMKPFNEITMGELPKDGDDYYFPIVYEWQIPGKESITGKYFFVDKRSEEINELLKEDYETYSKLPYSGKTDEGIKQIPLSIFYKNPIVKEFIDRGEIETNLLYVGVNILYANKDYNRIVAAQNPRLEEDDARKNSKTSIFENYKTNDIIPLEIKSVQRELQKREDEIEMMSDISWKWRESMLYCGDHDNKPQFLYFDLDDKIHYMKKKLQDHMDEWMRLRYAKFSDSDIEKISKTMIPDLNQPLEFIRNLKRDDIDDMIVEYAEIQVKKVKLFLEVINNKVGLTDKEIFINGKTGEIELKVDFEEERTLLLEKLSSGEKNILLLYFHLIFEVPTIWPEKTTYIELIDEPEVSMHPDWLITFIENLNFINKELGRGDNFQFIVATHSPAITYANSNLMVEMRRN